MSLMAKASTGRIILPPITIVYMPPGLGKTTIGASYPKVRFIDFEEGSYEFDAAYRDEPKSWKDTMGLLTEFYESDSLDFDSVCIDTLSSIEVAMHIQLALDHDKESIEDIGWQKGYQIALKYWAEFIVLIKKIRRKHGTNFILLAHAADIKKEDMHLGAKYSRYGMNLHLSARDYLFGQVDMVLFGRRDIALKKQKGKDIQFAKDMNRVFLHTRYSVHWDAKNRYGMPEKMELPREGAYDMFKYYIDNARNETPEIAYKECQAAITRIKDQDLVKQMKEYIKKPNILKSVAQLRSALEMILDKVKEQDNEENN